MKLLFDQNISFRVIKKIADNYPEAKQVRMLGLENYADMQIWEYAREKGYTIVTFDADFYDLVNLKGHPPKIIWLRCGNTTTISIAKIFNRNLELIKDFVDNPENKDMACIEIE